MSYSLAKIISVFGLFTSFCSPLISNDELIIVEKKNVVHKFVKTDAMTDHFTQQVFKNWENETFEVFDQYKNPEGIAIDIGAWIGTTSIWLSKNFYHVLAVDGDKDSLKCLKANLKASDCPNVTICENPVSQKADKLVFGPRGSVLNESISYIKDQTDSPLHYLVKTITFKQLIHDKIYLNENLKSKKITFIKCDIEGGEEHIMEDVLHFAYHNQCPVYMSFHACWWTSRKISDFDDLFRHFSIKGHPSSDKVSQLVMADPFISLLLEPKTMGPMIKPNMTAVIIGYNQYTYIKNMVSQLEKYTQDIVIIDNNSHFQPLLDYYEMDYKYTLLRQKINKGHNIYNENWVKSLTGSLFLVTDPDLKFNSKLPENFISHLLDVSNHFKASKVGFALDIQGEDIMPELSCYHKSVKEWESQFWVKKLEYLKNSLELYEAEIDSTFCLINTNFQDSLNIRIAGDYTCKHIPWHKNFAEGFLDGEKASYQKDNISSIWFKRD